MSVAGPASLYGHARITLDPHRRSAPRDRLPRGRAPRGRPSDRVTCLVRLRGGGAEGLGEDVGGDMADGEGAFLAAAPGLALAGDWTFASFCAHLAAIDVWPEAPEWDMAR